MARSNDRLLATLQEGMQLRCGHNTITTIPFTAYSKLARLGHLLRPRISSKKRCYRSTLNENGDDILPSLAELSTSKMGLTSVLTHAQTLSDPDTPNASQVLPTVRASPAN
eukprot:4546086-Amphidinium_carterae.1